MPTFQVVEALPHMCGAMARKLRSEHKAAIKGENAHRHLCAMFNSSAFRRAWLIDGSLAGLGGVSGSLSSGRGVVWLALSDEAMRYPLALVREVAAQLAEIGATKYAVHSTVAIRDKKALRFASFLGFEVDHTLTTEFGVGIIFRSDHGF